MEKQFDLSDAIERLDAEVARLKANLSPSVPYDWEVQRAREAALEAEADRHHTAYIRAAGMAAHYKKALDSIAGAYYFTSEGAACCTLAKKALEFPPAVEPTNNETEQK